jgi:hypothetical protein
MCSVHLDDPVWHLFVLFASGLRENCAISRPSLYSHSEKEDNVGCLLLAAIKLKMERAPFHDVRPALLNRAQAYLFVVYQTVSILC